MSKRQVSIPISADTYNEFILRKGESVDVAQWIENIVEDFLDRTAEDPGIWSEEYLERLEDEEVLEQMAKFGSPNRGYHWQSLFLPNGTRLRMTYQGRDHFAEVRHQQVMFDGQACSPSEFASRAANNTSRNAWRDIWVLFPGEREWQAANVLRRQQQ